MNWQERAWHRSRGNEAGAFDCSFKQQQLLTRNCVQARLKGHQSDNPLPRAGEGAQWGGEWAGSGKSFTPSNPSPTIASQWSPPLPQGERVEREADLHFKQHGAPVHRGCAGGEEVPCPCRGIAGARFCHVAKGVGARGVNHRLCGSFPLYLRWVAPRVKGVFC